MPKPRTTNSVVASSPTASAEAEEPRAPQPQFMRCKCIGALPGRCCPRCSGTRYLKRCQPCNGYGLIFKNTRKGAEPRGEKCGPCMGFGWKSAMPGDLPAISEMEAKIAARQDQPAA